MALAAAQRQGKCPADVPIYCAEWKAPREVHAPRSHSGPRPRSRVTNQRRLSEDEVAVLFEAIGDDLDSIGFSPSPNSGDDVSEQKRSDKTRGQDDGPRVGWRNPQRRRPRGAQGPLQ